MKKRTWFGLILTSLIVLGYAYSIGALGPINYEQCILKYVGKADFSQQYGRVLEAIEENCYSLY